MGVEDKQWQTEANCLGSNHLMYEAIWPEANTSEVDPSGVNEEAMAHAVALCHSCPVRHQCYQLVMQEEAGQAAHSRFGLTASMTPAQRWSAEKRRATTCSACSATYDPVEVVQGVIRCPSCGNERITSPIPVNGDQWNKRHTTLARRVVRWLVENTRPGDEVPLPTPLARRFEVRTADMARVYEALVADGTIGKVGRGYERRDIPAVSRLWHPEWRQPEDE